MFDTSEEANQKLRHSVVLHRKEPVYIQEATGRGKSVNLHYTKIAETSTPEIRCIFDPDWNFRDLGPHLGYANIDLGSGGHKEACYITRMPVRQCSSTQGISQRNLHIPQLRGSSKLALGALQLSFQHIYNLKPFKDMLRDIYPDFESIKEEFKKSPWLISKAFTHEFAVRRADVGPFYLQYKGKDVGHSDDLYRWRIADQFSYLKETMDHINLRVA